MRDEMNLNACLVPSSEIAARVIDGEAVIVTIENGRVYTLNPVATSIWELIEKNVSIKEIINKITSEFKVDRETVIKDTLNFLHEMKKKNIITIEPKKGGG